MNSCLDPSWHSFAFMLAATCCTRDQAASGNCGESSRRALGWTNPTQWFGQNQTRICQTCYSKAICRAHNSHPTQSLLMLEADINLALIMCQVPYTFSSLNPHCKPNETHIIIPILQVVTLRLREVNLDPRRYQVQGPELGAWLTPVIPAVCEAQVAGLLVLRSLRPA